MMNDSARAYISIFAKTLEAFSSLPDNYGQILYFGTSKLLERSLKFKFAKSQALHNRVPQCIMDECFQYWTAINFCASFSSVKKSYYNRIAIRNNCGVTRCKLCNQTLSVRFNGYPKRLWLVHCSSPPPFVESVSLWPASLILRSRHTEYALICELSYFATRACYCWAWWYAIHTLMVTRGYSSRVV